MFGGCCPGRFGCASACCAAGIPAKVSSAMPAAGLNLDGFIRVGWVLIRGCRFVRPGPVCLHETDVTFHKINLFSGK